MIDASLYYLIYLIVVTVLTSGSIGTRNNPDIKGSVIFSSLLCVFLILFIGFRPIAYVFVDMMNYAQGWGISDWYSFDITVENLLFDNLYTFMSGTGYSITSFFVLIAAIYFTCMLIACHKLFPSNTLIAFLVCLGAFSTFSYGTNGIKAGAAASLFLVALAYRDKIWVSIFFLFLSWGFHHSMQMPVAAYVMTLIFKDKNWYFYGWCFCLLMAILHISYFQNLFAGFTDERGAEYLMASGQDWGGKSGFRWDFVIYSAMPALMGYYVKYKYLLEDKLYDIMLNIYLTCNGVWMLCMYASFTNRIAYLSWFMYPILLIYPCYTIADESHPLVQYRKKIVLAHLVFTLFMTFIYY